MNSIEYSFFINNDTFKRLTFFSMLDILMVIFWIILIVGFAFYKRSRHPQLEYYNFYFKNLLFKITFGLVFSMFYILYYGGGDTTAYWDLAGCMNKLFWESPKYYFNNLFLDFHDPNFINKYSLKTGYPPTWIMRERQGFFVSKIVSLFTFVTANSYLAITILFSTIAANVTWRFYEMVRLWIPEPSKFLTYSVLFIPSVAFWCSGITKDTFVLISILSIVTHAFRILKGKQPRIIWSIIVILFHVWMLLNIRSVILMTLFIPFFIAMSARISNRFKEFIYFKRLVQFLVASISLAVFFVILQTYGTEISVDKYIKEAEVVQKDFANNAAYTGSKYTIEVSDYSITGIFLSMPTAIVAGLFRPFLWEALSPTLLLNGLESLALLYLLFLLLKKNLLARFRLIRSNEFLLFCLFFVLIYGLITGFSSVIFGVLVRLRAPLLPFLGILLTNYMKPKPKEKDDTIHLKSNSKLMESELLK